MILTNGKEFIIDNVLVKTTLIDNSTCNGCDLKGLSCTKIKELGIRRCFVGSTPVIFKKVEISNDIKREIETLVSLKVDKSKILDKYNISEEQFNFIVDKKV